MKITYQTPASRWGEALPLGNGHMGAMVYSGIEEERIDLSENTFFSGKASMTNNRPGADKSFYRMRELLKAEDFKGAREEAEGYIGIREDYGTNLPVGTIKMKFGREGFSDNSSGRGACTESSSVNNGASVYDYERGLDISTGIASSSYQREGQSVEKKLFISHPDKVFVYQLQSSHKMDEITLSMEPGNDASEVEYLEEGISFICRAYETMHCDNPCGTYLYGKLQIQTDGILCPQKNSIEIKNASRVIWYLMMDSDFKTTEDSQAICKRLCSELERLQRRSLEEIQEAHCRDVGSLFSRVSLRINEENPRIMDEHDKTGQLPFMFQYGRYLLWSSSREDSRLPAHLQGIWNDNVACRIGWTCDMHLDINTQMNYWPAEVTNLPETAQPLFRWIEEDLAVSGSLTAKESYGLGGWVAEIVSNAWGFSAPYWASPIAPCPTGGVWILTHMWEHYLYTKDLDFLKTRAFPAIESAALFFTNYVFEDQKTGYLTCGPSISPENSFYADEMSYQISNGCTYEILMIRELFQIYLKAAKLIGDTKTEPLAERIAYQIKRLLPYRITKEGTLAEWSHDYPAADLQHRHTSHLLGLFPFAQITPKDTPQLARAAEKSILQKLIPAENWEDTGWARSMLMLYEARLEHGERAYEHIESMLSVLLEKNHFIIHPPTRGAGSFDNVYELDGNTGLTSCIAEMLLQSHSNRISLLPALPKAWKDGMVTGLIARGGVKVDITWKDGILIEAILCSPTETKCTIRYQQKEHHISLKPNVPLKYNLN